MKTQSKMNITFSDDRDTDYTNNKKYNRNYSTTGTR